jgi:hypothetical protein
MAPEDTQDAGGSRETPEEPEATRGAQETPGGPGGGTRNTGEQAARKPRPEGSNKYCSSSIAQ